MLKFLIAVLSILPFTAWRADAQAMQRVRPPEKPTCSSMPTAGRTVGELCSSTGDGTLRYWNGSEWSIIGVSSGEELTDGCIWIHLQATSGNGEAATPWTGWAEQITGQGNYCFRPGYYDQEEVLFDESVSNVHIKCEEGATFLRRRSTGSFFRTVDAQSPEDAPVSVTKFSVEGCTFDYNNIATGEVGSFINYDSSIGLWRTTGMHEDIIIRNNTWINLGEVAYTYYVTRGDSALLSFYAGKRFLIEGNRVIKTNFDPDQHGYAFVWFTAGEDILIRDNEFTNGGLLKLEAYNWQPQGNTQRHMERVAIVENKFNNIAFTNMILRNTCIVAGAEGPASINNILISGNISTSTDYTVAGKGLVGVAATWAQAACDAPAGPIFSENVIIANNQMRGMRGNFIAVGGEGALGYYGAVRNITVIGNVADGAYPDEATVDSSCDYSNPNGLCNSFGFNSNAFESENITISGNTFRNLYLSCIYAYGNNITISGNTCDEAVKHENAGIFYINAGILADGDNILITGNTVRNVGDPDNSLDGTNPFQPYGIFIPTGNYTENIRVTNNMIMDDRDHDITGDGTIDDTNRDGTTEATDRRAMGYGVRFGTGGSFGEYLQLTGNTINGAITRPWQVASIPDATVVYGNIADNREGSIELAPSINEVTYGFSTTDTTCLSATKDNSIFEDKNCNGIKNVGESGVSEPTPLNSNLFSVGDDAAWQPGNDPYVIAATGTEAAVNIGQAYDDHYAVATALQLYDTTSGSDMMVNIAATIDTSNIYAGLIPLYPFGLNFGSTLSLTAASNSAYLVGYAMTDTNADIYSKKHGIFYWCDPYSDIDGDGTRGDDDKDGTCVDEADCDWWAVSMYDGTDNASGELTNATNATVTDTGVSCVDVEGQGGIYQNLTILFSLANGIGYATFFIDDVQVAQHNTDDDYMPLATKLPFVGIWAQTNSTTQTGFAWDFVGAAGTRRIPPIEDPLTDELASWEDFLDWYMERLLDDPLIP